MIFAINNICSGNGLLPLGSKLLSEPMVIQIKQCRCSSFSQHETPGHAARASAERAAVKTRASQSARKSYRKISRSLEDAKFRFRFLKFAVKIDRHLGSSSAEMPVKYQSDTIIITPNLETLRDLAVRCLIAQWIEAMGLSATQKGNHYKLRNNGTWLLHSFVVGYQREQTWKTTFGKHVTKLLKLSMHESSFGWRFFNVICLCDLPWCNYLDASGMLSKTVYVLLQVISTASYLITNCFFVKITT